MSQYFLLKKSVSIALSLVFFLTNGLFAYTLENNFWKQRQKTVTRISSLVPRNSQLAQLPANLQSVIPNTNLSFPQKNFGHSIIQNQVTRNKLREMRFSKILQALPPSLGSVRSLNFPENADENKLIIHFQDVHQNSEAQSNLSEALRSLTHNSEIDLVALEGAFTPIDLKPFQAFPHPQAVLKASEYLLKENKISGPIFTALTEPETFPPILGVDDKVHYKANVAAYKNSIALKAKTEKDLQSKIKDLNKDKNSVFNLNLKEFDSLVQSYRNQTIGQGQFIAALSQNTKEPLSSNLELFLEAFRLESKLNFSLIESQRSQLIEQLLTHLSKTETQELIQISVAYRISQVSHADFYSYLKNLCEKADVSLEKFSAMDQYIRYVLLTEQIEPEALFREIRQTENKIYANLSITLEEQELVRLSNALHLTEKLINFSLTPEEWSEYQTLRRTNNTLQTEFELFYEHAAARDKAITENLIQAMNKNDAKIAVLVTGGFHSHGISRLLEEQKISSLSFSPKITRLVDDSGSAYLSVFTQEKTPLEELFQGEKLYTAQPPAPQSVRHGLLPALVVGLLSIWGILGSSATSLFKRMSPTILSARTKTEGNRSTVTTNSQQGSAAIDLSYEGTQEEGEITQVHAHTSLQSRIENLLERIIQNTVSPLSQVTAVIGSFSVIAYLAIQSSASLQGINLGISSLVSYKYLIFILAITIFTILALDNFAKDIRQSISFANVSGLIPGMMFSKFKDDKEPWRRRRHQLGRKKAKIYPKSGKPVPSFDYDKNERGKRIKELSEKGEAAKRNDNLKGAETNFELALSIDYDHPDNYPVRISLVTIYIKTGRLDLANQRINELLIVLENNYQRTNTHEGRKALRNLPFALQEKARILSLQGDFDTALKTVEQAIHYSNLPTQERKFHSNQFTNQIRIITQQKLEKESGRKVGPLGSQLKEIREKKRPETPSIIGQYLNKDRENYTSFNVIVDTLIDLISWGGRLTHEGAHYGTGLATGDAKNYTVVYDDLLYGMPWETKGFTALSGLAANLIVALVFGWVTNNSINSFISLSPTSFSPGSIVVFFVASYMFISNAFLFATEILLTPFAGRMGLTDKADILQFVRGLVQQGLPDPVTLFEKSYNLAPGMSYSIQNDPDEVAESYAAHYISYLQHFQYDDRVPNKDMVPVVNQTGDTPWPGNALIIKWVNTWESKETQHKLHQLQEKYGVDPALKPDVTRIIAFPMDAIFFQKRDAYYAFAKQLRDFWAPLGIPEENMNFFYGDITLNIDEPLTQKVDLSWDVPTRPMEKVEFELLMADVKRNGLLINEFLNNELAYNHVQYAPLRAMHQKIKEMRKKLEDLGGPMIVGGGIGPGYDGEGHFGFTELDKDFKQEGFIGPSHNFVRKGHAKEDGGMSNRYNKDGKPIDGVITFSYADFFKRGRDGKDMRTILLATNNNKAEAVRKLAQEPRDPKVPTSVVQEVGKGTRVDSGVVIADHGSAHLLRFETHPWEFQLMSEEDWTDEMIKKFFIQLSKDAGESGKPIPQLLISDFLNPASNTNLKLDRQTANALNFIFEENRKSLLKKGDWNTLRDRVVRNIITGQQIFDNTSEEEFLETHQSHQYGVRTAEELVKLLGITSKDTLLLVDPHSDDSPLAVRALIEAYKAAGANVISLVVTAGFTSVHDSFITQSLRNINTFDLDDLKNLTNTTIESLTQELVDLKGQLRAFYADTSSIPQNPWGQLHPDVHANMDSWNQMNSTEQNIRAKILLLQIKEWFQKNRIPFTKQNLKGYIDFAIGASPTKPSWSSRDLKIMEDMKKWVRMTENRTAMMSYSLDFNDVRFLNSTWYTNQGRGPAAGRDDIELLEDFILDLIDEGVTPTHIISNGEGFPDYGAHANTEITLSIAIARLVKKGILKPSNLKYFKYAGVWERLTLHEAGFSIVLDEETVRKERDEFPRHFPSQDFAQVPDSGIVNLGSFIDQVHLVNGANSRDELINAIGPDHLDTWLSVLKNPGSSVLNYKTVDLTNPDVINEILEKQLERERVAATKGAATNKEMNGIMPRASGIQRGIFNLRAHAPTMAIEIGNRESPLNDMFEGLRITPLRLRSVMNNFLRDINLALDKRKSSLAMNPTFAVEPKGNEKGEYLTVNVGGTTARAFRNRLQGKGKEPQVLESVEFDYTEEMRKDPYSIFEFLADEIIPMIEKNTDYEIGVTFSFSLEQSSLREAETESLVKRLTDSDNDDRKIIGRDPGIILTDILRKKGYHRISVNAIANDTLSPILTWLYNYHGKLGLISRILNNMTEQILGPLYAVAGVILGTGHNVTFKWDDEFYNLESGGFSGAKHIQNHFDHLLEEIIKDDIPVGVYTFEKMISGAYLGELLRLHLVELGKVTPNFHWGHSELAQRPFTMDSRYISLLLISGDQAKLHNLAESHLSKVKDKDVVLPSFETSNELIQELFKEEYGLQISNPEIKILRQLARKIAMRSALLVSAELSALIKKTDPYLLGRHVFPTEGSVFWGVPHYEQMVRVGIRGLLGSKANRKISFSKQVNSTAVGIGIAAAAAKRAEQEQAIAAQETANTNIIGGVLAVILSLSTDPLGAIPILNELTLSFLFIKVALTLSTFIHEAFHALADGQKISLEVFHRDGPWGLFKSWLVGTDITDAYVVVRSTGKIRIQYVAFAGPFANALLILIGVGLYSLFPASYPLVSFVGFGIIITNISLLLLNIGGTDYNAMRTGELLSPQKLFSQISPKTPAGNDDNNSDNYKPINLVGPVDIKIRDSMGTDDIARDSEGLSEKIIKALHTDDVYKDLRTFDRNLDLSGIEQRTIREILSAVMTAVQAGLPNKKDSITNLTLESKIVDGVLLLKFNTGLIKNVAISERQLNRVSSPNWNNSGSIRVGEERKNLEILLSRKIPTLNGKPENGRSELIQKAEDLRNNGNYDQLNELLDGVPLKIKEGNITLENEDLLSLLSFDHAASIASSTQELMKRANQQRSKRKYIMEGISSRLRMIYNNDEEYFTEESRDVAMWLLSMNYFDSEGRTYAKSKFSINIQFNQLHREVIGKYLITVKDDPLTKTVQLVIGRPKPWRLRLLWILFPFQGVRRVLGQFNFETTETAKLTFTPRSHLADLKMSAVDSTNTKPGTTRLLHSLFSAWDYYANVPAATAKRNGVRITTDKVFEGIFANTGFKVVGIDGNEITYEKKEKSSKPRRVKTTIDDINKTDDGRSLANLVAFVLLFPEEILHIFAAGFGLFIPINWPATFEAWSNWETKVITDIEDTTTFKSKTQLLWMNLVPVSVWAYLVASYFYPTIFYWPVLSELINNGPTVFGFTFSTLVQFYAFGQAINHIFQFIIDLIRHDPHDRDPKITSDVFRSLLIVSGRLDQDSANTHKYSLAKFRQGISQSKALKSSRGGLATNPPRAALRRRGEVNSPHPNSIWTFVIFLADWIVKVTHQNAKVDLADSLLKHDSGNKDINALKSALTRIFQKERRELGQFNRYRSAFQEAHDFETGVLFDKALSPDDPFIWWSLPETDINGNPIMLKKYLTDSGFKAYQARNDDAGSAQFPELLRQSGINGYQLTANIFREDKVEEYYQLIDKPEAGQQVAGLLRQGQGSNIIVVDAWAQPWSFDEELGGGLDQFRESVFEDREKEHQRISFQRHLESVLRAKFIQDVIYYRAYYELDPLSDRDIAYINWILWKHFELGSPLEELSQEEFSSEDASVLISLDLKQNSLQPKFQRDNKKQSQNAKALIIDFIRRLVQNTDDASFGSTSSLSQSEDINTSNNLPRSEIRGLTPGGPGEGAPVGSTMFSRQSLNSFGGGFSQNSVTSESRSSADAQNQSIAESNAETRQQTQSQAAERLFEDQRDGSEFASQENKNNSRNRFTNRIPLQNYANVGQTNSPNTQSNNSNFSPLPVGANQNLTKDFATSERVERTNQTGTSKDILENIPGIKGAGNDGFDSPLSAKESRGIQNNGVAGQSGRQKPGRPSNIGNNRLSVLDQQPNNRISSLSQSLTTRPETSNGSSNNVEDTISNQNDNNNDSRTRSAEYTVSQSFSLTLSQRITSLALSAGLALLFGWPAALVAFISLRAIFSIRPILNQTNSTQNILISIIPGLTIVLSVARSLTDSLSSFTNAEISRETRSSTAQSTTQSTIEPITITIPAVSNTSDNSNGYPIAVSLTFTPKAGTNVQQTEKFINSLLRTIKDGLFSISAQAGKPVNDVVEGINNQLQQRLRRQVQNVMIRAALNRLRQAISKYDWNNDNNQDEEDLFRKSVLEAMIEINSATLTIQEAIIREKFSYTIRGESIMNFLDLLEKLLRANGYLEDVPLEDETTTQSPEDDKDKETTTWEIGDPEDNLEPTQGQNPQGDETPLEDLVNPDAPGPLGELPEQAGPNTEDDQTKAPQADSPQSIENSFATGINRQSGLFGLDQSESEQESQTEAAIGLNPVSAIQPLTNQIDALIAPLSEETSSEDGVQLNFASLALLTLGFGGAATIIYTNYLSFSLIGVAIQSFALLEGISLVHSLITNDIPPPFKPSQDPFEPRRDRNPKIVPEQPSKTDEETEIPVQPRIPNTDVDNIADAVLNAAEAYRQLDNINKYDLSEILDELLPDLVRFDFNQTRALGKVGTLNQDEINKLISVLRSRSASELKGPLTQNQAREVISWLFQKNWKKDDSEKPIGDGSVFMHAQGGTEPRRKREAKAAFDLSRTVKKGDYVYVLINRNQDDIDFFTKWRDDLMNYEETDKIRLVIREQDDELITTDGNHQIVNLVQLGLGLRTLADIWGDETLNQLTVTLPDGTILGEFDGLEIDEFSTLGEILESVNYIWLQQWFDEGEPAPFQQMQNIEELAEALTHA